jgi:hypothetical protein
MASTETGEPDKFVSSYLWNQPEDRGGWRRELVDLYQRVVLFIFLKLLYRYSLTAVFIRF